MQPNLGKTQTPHEAFWFMIKKNINEIKLAKVQADVVPSSNMSDHQKQI